MFSAKSGPEVCRGRGHRNCGRSTVLALRSQVIPKGFGYSSLHVVQQDPTSLSAVESGKPSQGKRAIRLEPVASPRQPET